MSIPHPAFLAGLRRFTRPRELFALARPVTDRLLRKVRHFYRQAYGRAIVALELTKVSRQRLKELAAIARPVTARWLEKYVHLMRQAVGRTRGVLWVRAGDRFLFGYGKGAGELARPTVGRQMTQVQYPQNFMAAQELAECPAIVVYLSWSNGSVAHTMHLQRRTGGVWYSVNTSIPAGTTEYYDYGASTSTDRYRIRYNTADAPWVEAGVTIECPE